MDDFADLYRDITEMAKATAAASGRPWVLYGHSLGGLYVRYYAHEHPERVVGMVLVDSGHEDYLQRLPPAMAKADEQAALMMRIPEVVSSIGLLARDPAGYPDQFLAPQAPGCEGTYKAVVAMSDHFATANEESAAAEEIYAALRDLPDRGRERLQSVVNDWRSRTSSRAHADREAAWEAAKAASMIASMAGR